MDIIKIMKEKTSGKILKYLEYYVKIYFGVFYGN
jgi:hypothetical protein